MRTPIRLPNRGRSKLVRAAALAVTGVAFAGGAAPARANEARAQLRPTADGWALVAADDSVIYAATGAAARQLCLERARAAGVLRIVR
ncbi:MAG: hypothetical protein QOC95_2644 [Thermoleophilaceae bacterium]|jgi:hypothetical protein|nr:hypothetical protein [Thermoleophilaceae bacterium]